MILLVLAAAPRGATAQTSGLAQIMDEPNLLLLHSSSQGYLGVLVGDVDSDSAAKLKLKEVRGAVVTLIDHDAPAAQAGIRVNDVFTQVNGQTVEGAEQFSRMMREIPAGHKVVLTISRDGSPLTLTVELVDHKKMEHDVWNRLDNGGVDSSNSAPGMGILSGAGDVPESGGFHMPFFGSTLNVGAMVEPLTSQMAEYLGIQSGLMIKQVARKSEAEAAGLKAFDIILKVGNDGIATTADWDRALRANQNKPVQVTILRDRRQQTVTLQVDSKHHRAELEDCFPDSDCPLMAALDAGAADQLAQSLVDSDAMAQAMQDQAEQLRQGLGTMQPFSGSPEAAEKLRQQAEQAAKQLQDQNFQLDQKQLDQLKQQIEKFQQDFKPDDFKIDQKQMEEFQRQMQQFRSVLPPDFDKELREQMQRQMDQLKRQLEEMQTQDFEPMV